MRREVVPIETDDMGREHHPRFAIIGANRVHGGDNVLFDSDVKHNNKVVIRLQTASRTRSGPGSDHIMGEKLVAEVELSEAQWASFVSTMNSGDGVPCTLRFRELDPEPGALPYAPRLAKTMQENADAAHRAFDEILRALEELEAVDKAEKPSAKARKDAIFHLKCMIQNAVPNVEFAGERLAKHAEDVVQKARADVEAMVVQYATRLGVEAPVRLSPFVIEQGDTGG